MKIQACAAVLLLALSGGAVLNGGAGQPAGASKAVVQGNSEFACELYRQLAVADGNLFFSPYSISNALAMTYGGARGNTAKEMAATLHFQGGQAQFHPAFGDLVRRIQSEDKKRKYQLRIANRLWGQKDFGFVPEFIASSAKHYGAGLEEVDFGGATEQARQAINAWVEKQTQDKIKELLKPGILDSLTKLVLTNAIYFKAAWSSPFDAQNTKPGEFLADGTKKVKTPMMHQSQRTRYLDGGTFAALEMPYEQRELSMIVFLPKKADGLAAFEKTLTAGNLAKWQAKLSDHQVDIRLPKFKTTAEFRLDKVLQQMGMRDAFDDRKADFTGLSSMKGLCITAVVHKAFIDVNEAGTEAAAATAIAIGLRSLPPPARFHADHPFVYLIRDNKTGSVLFMGRVVNP
ncbi:MAG: serpin family protein [Gemmataceae bacterium]|nr:serpin family protein [Gemmataceae bacterium]